MLMQIILQFGNAPGLGVRVAGKCLLSGARVAGPRYVPAWLTKTKARLGAIDVCCVPNGTNCSSSRSDSPTATTSTSRQWRGGRGREHGASRACARRFESKSVKRDEPRALKLRPEVSPREDERDGNPPHPTP
jgi:hypothetical protein